MIGDGVVVQHGRLRASRPSDQLALERIVAAAIERGQFELEPIALERKNGRPLIVQALPIDPAATGRPSALLLIKYPTREAKADLEPALQLLGLTPAEAKIATLVGSDNSPREAAQRLDNSEGTVCTALNRIYEKLDINRQSELARIVARLETIGP